MSDKDQNHLLDELQAARAEVDQLRSAIAKHQYEMREYKGAFYDLELWKTINPLPNSDTPAFSRKTTGEYKCLCGTTKISGETCPNCSYEAIELFKPIGPLPGGE